MDQTLLLIGLEDAQAVQKKFEMLKQVQSILICETLQQAKEILLTKKIMMFVLDTRFGEEQIYSFFQWILDNKPTFGILMGDQMNNKLGINSMNTGFIINYLVRPIDKSKCLQAMESYHYYYNRYGYLVFEELYGSKLLLQ